MREAFHTASRYSYNSGISNYVNQLLKLDVSKEKLHIISPEDELVGDCSLQASGTTPETQRGICLGVDAEFAPSTRPSVPL